MLRSPFSLTLLSAFLLPVLAQAQAPSADIQTKAVRAVVRIPSHGVSAECIWTTPQGSLLLGCAHGFAADPNAERMRPSQQLIKKPICVDHWSPNPGPPREVVTYLVAVDFERDLSLIWFGAELHGAVTVPLRGYQPSRRCLSVGYDSMQWPAVQAPATLRCAWAYTDQMPRPGRSGGALVDERGHLVGVCSAYEEQRDTRGRVLDQRGKYVGLVEIHDFLERCGWNVGGKASPQPIPQNAPNMQRNHPPGTAPPQQAIRPQPQQPQQQPRFAPAPPPGGG